MNSRPMIFALGLRLTVTPARALRKRSVSSTVMTRMPMPRVVVLDLLALAGTEQAVVGRCR